MIDTLPAPDLRLDELRLVAWDLVGQDAQGKPLASSQKELVPTAEVELLVKAVVRLHHALGVNPHSGRPTARLERVRVGVPALGPGYWWTSPALDDAGPKARLVGWTWTTAWELPGTDPDPG